MAVNAVTKFIAALQSLVRQGLSKQAAEQFAKNEFGEISKFLQKRIDDVYKNPKGEGIESIKIKDEVFDDTVVKLPIDDTGQPFNPNNPLKEYGKKTIEGQMEKINKASSRLDELMKEREAMFKPKKPEDKAKGGLAGIRQGRINFDGGGSPLQRLRQEIVDSMKGYAPGDVTEDQLQLVVKDITLDMTPEQAQASALSNFRKLFGMASGGRAGHYTGGMVDVEPNLSDIGHGSDALMARTRLVSPNSQATTSTGLNYLLAEDNDNIRVPFAKGKGVDLLRRGFLKTMGIAGAGIAALKTGLLGLGGKQATKEVAKEIITTPAAAGKPEWFDALVTRVIREGDDVTKTMATKDREIVYRKKIDDETEVLVTQDLDEGVTRIDIDDSTRNVTGFDDPPTVSLQVTDEIVEEGGAKIKPEFKATENDYRNYATDPDGGYETEFVENTVEEVKDLTSDLTKVKSFATKKSPTMEEIVISKKKRDDVKYANENPSSYAADRGPDYDPSDYIEDMADDYASGGIARMIGE
jgi:hypothetical protein